jgi:hypothetical protein
LFVIKLLPSYTVTPLLEDGGGDITLLFEEGDLFLKLTAIHLGFLA